MSDIEDKIKQLKEIYNGKSCCQAMHGLHYYSCPEDSKLHGFRFFDKYRDYAGDTKLTEMTKKDLKLYIEAWQLYKEIFFKKLETYIKKYDLKHVGIHSYWIDR